MSAGSQIARTRLAVLMACHNRRQLTVECLRSIQGQDLPAGHSIDVFVLDDGSTDGTAEAVVAAYPSAEVIKGDGSLFWGGGMRAAFGAAMERGYDHYLWMNDDVTLEPDAIRRMLETYRDLKENRKREAIIVGVFADPETGETSYGGWQSISRVFPTRLRPVTSSNEVLACDAANGNCVLIPAKAATEVGNVDPYFSHRMGDMDYSFRARKKGFEIFMVPGVIGKCEQNRDLENRISSVSGVRERWRLFTSNRGLPVAEWREFNRRHGGPLWPILFLSPYVKFWASAITGFGRSRQQGH